MFSNIAIEFELIIATDKLDRQNRLRGLLNLASMVPIWPNNNLEGSIEL